LKKEKEPISQNLSMMPLNPMQISILWLRKIKFSGHNMDGESKISVTIFNLLEMVKLKSFGILVLLAQAKLPLSPHNSVAKTVISKMVPSGGTVIVNNPSLSSMTLTVNGLIEISFVY